MQLLPVLFELPFNIFVGRERYGFDFAESVAVVIAMLVVIAEYASIVLLKELMIDVGEVVASDPAFFIHPYFAAQLPIAAPDGYLIDIVVQFSVRHDS